MYKNVYKVLLERE